MISKPFDLSSLARALVDIESRRPEILRKKLNILRRHGYVFECIHELSDGSVEHWGDGYAYLRPQRGVVHICAPIRAYLLSNSCMNHLI